MLHQAEMEIVSNENWTNYSIRKWKQCVLLIQQCHLLVSSCQSATQSYPSSALQPSSGGVNMSVARENYKSVTSHHDTCCLNSVWVVLFLHRSITWWISQLSSLQQGDIYVKLSYQNFLETFLVHQKILWVYFQVSLMSQSHLQVLLQKATATESYCYCQGPERDDMIVCDNPTCPYVSLWPLEAQHSSTV